MLKAETGSGKTLSFTVPIVQELSKSDSMHRSLGTSGNASSVITVACSHSH